MEMTISTCTVSCCLHIFDSAELYFCLKKTKGGTYLRMALNKGNTVPIWLL